MQPEQRDQAKTLAYGLLFGMGATSLAGKLGVRSQAAGVACQSCADCVATDLRLLPGSLVCMKMESSDREFHCYLPGAM